MLKRLKKFGLPAVAFAAMLVLFTPPHADAKVRFGVSIGAPVYTYPVNPYANSYQYPPVAPDYYGYGYPAPVYPGPAYVAPYSSFGFSWGGHDRDHFDHERHERVEHQFREHHEDHPRR